jgi:IS605 OrfB family transposase
MRKLEFKTSNLFTYQTRINVSTTSGSFLCDYAKLYTMVERKLYADYCRDNNIISLKSDYIRRYGISARFFNSLRINLQGKIDSVLSRQNDYIKDIQARIKKTQKTIKLLKRKKSLTPKLRHNLHQQKRKLQRLEVKLQRLQHDKKCKRARICFGTKKLFNKQFNLDEGITHSDWRQEWESSRSCSFYIIGSKDESCGNQNCKATINNDGSIKLFIRAPKSLEDKYGVYIELDNIYFSYGHSEIVSAIKENLKRSQLSKAAIRKIYPDKYKGYGVAINYRLLKDKKSWRLFITTTKVVDKELSNSKLGAIGVDINESHLAITEIDSTGNYLNSFTVNTCTYGKSSNQAKAIIGDAVLKVVDYAVSRLKPIVIENLDFKDKKRDLSKESPKRARSLSSFSYSAIKSMIKAKAFRCAIAVHELNPAYSSIIGRVKFAHNYNISVHCAAALVMARRLYGYSERLPVRRCKVPTNQGFYVTLYVLGKNHIRHVWSSWANVPKQLETATASHYQMLRTSDRGRCSPGDDYIPF